MLHKIKEIIQRPTKHREVCCTIHHNGLRFCIEAGNRSRSIEHVGWSELENAGNQQAAEGVLEAAYARCLARADNARG